jgi:hypothetical protein
MSPTENVGTLDYAKLSRELGYQWIEDRALGVCLRPKLYDEPEPYPSPAEFVARAEAIRRFDQLAQRFRRD